MINFVKQELRSYLPYLLYLFNKGEPVACLIVIVGVTASVALLRQEHSTLGFTFFAATVCTLIYWKKRCDRLLTKRIVDRLMQQKNPFLSEELMLDAQEARNILLGQVIRSNWHKNVIQYLWPNYLSNLMQQEMDRVYKSYTHDKYKTNLDKVITFNRFEINQDFAPSISDITIVEDATRKDEIVISAYVKFYGNIRFSLATLTRPLILRDVYFREEARIILRPLQSNSPFVGGFAFSLCDKPVMDYNFDAEFKRLFKDDEDFFTFQDFLVSRVSGNFVAPQKIYIKFSEDDSLETTQKLNFPIPLAVVYVQVLEAENLTKTSTDYNPIGYLQIGNFRVKCDPKNKVHSPLFDKAYWTVVHDCYEQCDFEIISRSHKSDLALGNIKFTLKNIAFDVRGKSEQDFNFNGRDFWFPLGVSQGMVHMKLTLFLLSENMDVCRKTQEHLRGYDTDKYKFPVALISVFIKDFEKSSKDKQRRTVAEQKENVRFKVWIRFDEKDHYSTAVDAVKGLYVWDQGFHIFTSLNPFDTKKDLRFTLCESVRVNHMEEVVEVAVGKLVFNAGSLFTGHLTLWKPPPNANAEFGRLGIVVATRFVEANTAIIGRLC
ncbi:extended synaptotagmin-3-like protein, partial [Leptotrombidium deliense]